MDVTFTSSELGEDSSFINYDHNDKNNGLLFVYVRPRPAKTVQNPWSEKLPEQIGANKDGKIVPLKEFDLFDMLTGILSSKELHLFMEKEYKKIGLNKTK